MNLKCYFALHKPDKLPESQGVFSSDCSRCGKHLLIQAYRDQWRILRYAVIREENKK